MKTRKLGKDGPEISEIGFGAWAIGGNWGPQGESDSIEALERALDLGISFIDTAAGYGNGKSEKIIAKILKGRNEQVSVATKTQPMPGDWPPSPYDNVQNRYAESYLREHIEERLRFLETDCLDLLQLHTWTRAWNKNPEPFAVLKELKKEGKIRLAGVSTPEHDQNSVIDLMREGWVDVVQVIYNIFEQEPAAELLDVAQEMGVGIIVRVPFDEGALTGKFTEESTFPEGDFRRSYFAGDRISRTVKRAEVIKLEVADSGYTMPQAALKFILAHPAVSTVIPGMRNAAQAEANSSVSDLPEMPEELVNRLRQHGWRRAFWYDGK